MDADASESDDDVMLDTQAPPVDHVSLPLPPPIPQAPCAQESSSAAPPLPASCALAGPYPVSDGSAHRDEPGTATDVVTTARPSVRSHLHSADFGDGHGYSLGHPAALQAALLASGPAAMQDLEDASGNPIPPPNHVPVLSQDGAVAFVPVNQLASRPSSLAKYGSSDRAGIGASPGYDTWEIKVAMTRFIADTYGPLLTPPGMPSAMDCSMAVLNKARAWWSRRRDQAQLDPVMVRRVDEYMRCVTGDVRGPRPVLLAARALQAPAASGVHKRHSPSVASVPRPPSTEGGSHPTVMHPAHPPPRSRASGTSTGSPSGGGGRVA